MEFSPKKILQMEFFFFFAFSRLLLFQVSYVIFTSMQPLIAADHPSLLLVWGKKIRTTRTVGICYGNFTSSPAIQLECVLKI